MAKSIARNLADVASPTGVLDGTLSTAAQTNITSVGTLSSLTVSGNLNATLTTAAQGNITSLGTLSSLVIADGGNIGSASDTDAISISSGGVVTMNQIPVLSAGLNVSGGSIAGTLSTAAQPNITYVGTLTSLTVDDITINGSTISDAADFILDIGGDITLDADGGDVLFKDGGTHFGSIYQNSNNMLIYSAVSDANILLQGNDGGSLITALTLDMSEAGNAHFNQHAYFVDNGYVVLGAGEDVKIHSDGTNGTLATQNGNFTVDSAGEIILDADTQGSGNGILLKDAGLHYGSIFRSSSHLHLKAETQDKNLLFLTNNGGSELTAMTIQSDGKVGIGEATPDNALHIKGSGFNAAHIKVERTDVGSSNDAALVLKAAAGANADYGLGGIWFQNALDTNAYALIRARTDDSSGTSGRLDFITSASSVGNATAASMTIKSYGKVGIGVTDPLGKLHIQEGASGQGSVNSNFDQLVLEDDAHSGMTILSGTSSDGGIYFGDSGGNNLGQLKYRHSDNSFRFIVNNGSDSLVIESNGMKMSNNSGTSPKLELINVDTEDGDTGRESSLRFSGFRSGGESVDNAQISGHHFGTADDDKGGIIFWTNTGSGLTEKMRIKEDGKVLIGKISTSFGTEGIRIDPNNIQITRSGNTTVYLNRTSSDGSLLSFCRDGTERGSIGISTVSTSYYTTSDARLKDNIVDAPSASDDIDNIQVRSFDWKEDGSYQKYGMIAQELLPIAPEAVSQPEDSEEMMSIDYSKLVPMLVKEIQSLSARIRKLEEEK